MSKELIEKLRDGNLSVRGRPMDINHLLILHRKAANALEQADKELDKYRLFDKFGAEITDGCIVHWSDGCDGDPIEKRWDRIAVATRGANTIFKVIDSPSEKTRNSGMVFNLGSFIWADTEKYLTVVAKSEEEYRAKFKNAGECLAYVLEKANK